ncbi:Glycine betaine/proline/choline transporter [BD1-7 clade bacterium]|uniref:Glycine betaine/proline/choline transporter n=1 Tax=BD1-7 clade bacterium TaxID=2029982 RepID=A0A5S9PRH3_9GAMM|nr:Glycine betaine/proline/choline transporter [BD1-7 clade bacterium]
MADHRPTHSYFKHNTVRSVSLVLVVVAVAYTLIFEQQAHGLFSWLQNSSSIYFGWIFILLPLLCLFGCAVIMMTPLGRIRLGGADARAEYAWLHWLAMLFCAGMGAGIVFWGVAEPVVHYIKPPVNADLVDNALLVTFVNWGLHAWALFAMIALAMAYFAFNRGLPLSVRSLFYPFIGDRIYGVFGDLVDILAVVASLFGLATSLGLGVSQIATGLSYTLGLELTLLGKILLVAVLAGVATLSVVLGVSKGVLRLSYLNLWVAVGLFVFVLATGPLLWLVGEAPRWFGDYVTSIIWPAQMIDIYRENGAWAQQWTTFYMAWWLAWAPMTGLFIARISRGRTLREFVLGVLIAPTAVTLLWFCVFGGAGIHNTLYGDGSVSSALQVDYSTSFFALLDTLPLAFVTEVLALLLITIFFITSADSGALSIDAIVAHGNTHTTSRQRMIWPLATGAVAIILLISGGLQALQAAAVASALPFAFILLLALAGFARALWQDRKHAVPTSR